MIPFYRMNSVQEHTLHAARCCQGHRGPLPEIRRVIIQNLPEETFSGNPDEKWAAPHSQLLQTAEQGKIVTQVLPKPDPWVENQAFGIYA